MDMGLGSKPPPPPNMKIFQNWKFSLGLGHKMTFFMDMGLGFKNPPPNMKIFQNWNSH